MELVELRVWQGLGWLRTDVSSPKEESALSSLDKALIKLKVIDSPIRLGAL